MVVSSIKSLICGILTSVINGMRRTGNDVDRRLGEEARFLWEHILEHIPTHFP